MKRIQTIAAYLVVLALAGVSSLKSAEPGHVVGKAIVRSVSGAVTYTTAAGVSGKLRVNMELEPGATVITGPDSYAYLNVNGLSSTVRVAPDTTLAIPNMDRVGSARDSDTETMLDIKTGEVEGNVAKVSANSTYEIKTPHGVAGIRGTSWDVIVVLLQSGEYQVTFTSVTGQVIVSAVIGANTVVKTLNTGESWTPGYGDVIPTPLNLLQQYQNDINNMMVSLEGQPSPIPPLYPPYPAGGPPGQAPSSPDSSTGHSPAQPTD
jgi:hypothetical protein